MLVFASLIDLQIEINVHTVSLRDFFLSSYIITINNTRMLRMRASTVCGFAEKITDEKNDS